VEQTLSVRVPIDPSAKKCPDVTDRYARFFGALDMARNLPPLVPTVAPQTTATTGGGAR
jgi:hypothetical protein